MRRRTPCSATGSSNVKRLTREEAGAKLDAWCRRQRIAAEFEIRKVRDLDVLFVILCADA